jgi:ABC-type lipoprotein release transport system permease subunit
VGLALVGGLLGGVAGVYLYWHIYRASPLVILGLLGPALLLPVVVSLLAAIYPAWQASRVPPAEAMRYE